MNVMVSTAFLGRQALKCEVPLVSPVFSKTILYRFVSTNTAIHRGIRRSNSRADRAEPPNGHYGGRTDGFPRGRRDYPDQQQHTPPRFPRPNRQVEQDVGDMRKFAALREGRSTTRQERFQRGGTGESQPSFGSQYPGQGSGRPYELRETPDRRRRNSPTSEPFGNSSYPSSAPPDSTWRNRATRASIYGDSHNPPDNNRWPERERETDNSPRWTPNMSAPLRIRPRGRFKYSDSQRRTVRLARAKETPPGGHMRSNPPQGIPYTTPASEFLYGTSVVTAALKSSRRKLYKVYIYSSEGRGLTAQDASIRKTALAMGVQVVDVKGNWIKLLDKMSNGRPHNGYILEASPLQRLPVTGLQPVPHHRGTLQVSLNHQSREEKNINGTDPCITYQTEFPRYPFVVLLDGILNPGNLGAILRTAFFLGVDAVAISNRNSAPLSPVALKASAGACESLPLLSISKPANFIDESRKNGWKFYSATAAASPFSSHMKSSSTALTTSTLGHPTLYHPCVLMLGGEGEGLRWLLQKKADFTVAIEGKRAGQGGVDSLNVSVAAGTLCEAFLRTPPPDQISELRDDPARLEYSGPSLDSSAEESGHGDTDDDLDVPQAEDLGIIDESKTHDFTEDSVSAEKARLF